MRLLRYSFLIILIISFIFALGCSKDNPVNNNNTEQVTDDLTSFVCLSVGNWWLRDNYAIDSSGNKTGTASVDSTAVTASIQKLGHQAFQMTTYDLVNDSVAVQYAYTEGLKYYMHSTFFNARIKFMLRQYTDKPVFDIGDRWILLADYNQNNWDIMADTLVDYPIYSDVNVSGVFSLKGQKGVSKTMKIGTTTIKAQEFKINFEFNGTNSKFPGQNNFNFVTHVWMNKKVGIVQITYDRSVYNIGIPFPVEGSEIKVTKYLIKETN